MMVLCFLGAIPKHSPVKILQIAAFNNHPDADFTQSHHRCSAMELENLNTTEDTVGKEKDKTPLFNSN